VIASIAGKTVDDFREVARKLQARSPVGIGGVVGIEVNLSCPNVEHRGLVFACSPDDSAEVIAAVAREADVPVFAKLTSDVTDIVEIARAVVDAGADGLTLINTLLGMAIDPETGRPQLSNTYGGLSGPAIRPVAVRNVHQVHQALPRGADHRVRRRPRPSPDVIEFVRAGATAVAVGTATFIDPFAAKLLVDDLRGWLAQRGIRSIAELRGRCTHGDHADVHDRVRRGRRSRPRIIVALDVPTLDEAEQLARARRSPSAGSRSASSCSPPTGPPPSRRSGRTAR
jgi:dihydroorotate dehydrogenase (NAD+) catalytic subunit